jgi:hypothetical protein
MATPDPPELTETQLDFLRLYRRLEVELGRAPSLGELADAHGGYSERSKRAAPQKMLDKLVEKGVIERARVELVGGGVTKLGMRLLKRERGQD